MPFTLKEESARAQSYGVSVSKFRGMTPIERMQAATAKRRARESGARTISTTAPPPPSMSQPSFAPTPWAQTQPGMSFEHGQRVEQIDIERRNAEALEKRRQENALVLQAAEQKFQAGEAERQRQEEAKVRAAELARVRQENINSLRMERQTTFSQLIQSGDTVRAVLFASGYGPENDVFDVRAKQLGVTMQELKGTAGLRATTEAALSKVLSRRVTIGQKGVRGLGPAVKSAKAIMQGGSDVRQLLTSAFGVGSLAKGEQPGMSQERLFELAQEVTPTGVV